MFVAATKGYPNPFDDSSRWSDEFKNFISLCLKVDPSKRSSSELLIKHPWLKKKASKSEMKDVFNAVQKIPDKKPNNVT